MINRTILNQIIISIKSRPVTLITGARGVGKTIIANHFTNSPYNFNYVSLDSQCEIELAKKDPILFLSLHPWPLIIDEVQRAPELFEALEEIVNKEKLHNIHNYGMYILAGSHDYRYMKNVNQSMAGRVSITRMLPLSRSEILGISGNRFDFDLISISKKAQSYPLSPSALFDNIIKGSYPELYNNTIKTDEFYSNYLKTYFESDISELINDKKIDVFRKFMELMATLTGEELVYSKISKIIGVDIKTIELWVDVLLTTDIIYLLPPYCELSNKSSRYFKLYFNDTGLACYLAKFNSSEVLRTSALNGRFMETYIINEIKKSYYNSESIPSLYYYRDTQGNEIDLVILDNGTLHMVECKAGMSYNMSAVKSFKQLANTQYKIGICAIICNTDTIYPLDENIYVLPLAGI